MEIFSDNDRTHRKIIALEGDMSASEIALYLGLDYDMVLQVINTYYDLMALDQERREERRKENDDLAFYHNL